MQQQQQQRRLDQHECHALMVAAIDFGTTFSGYAFSFWNDFITDPMKVTASQWTTGSKAGVSLKAPSCLLFMPNKMLHSFGTDAEEKYADLLLDELHHDWYYFRRFKMLLYSPKTLNRDMVIHDETGKPMKAMDVFAAAISYLKTHLLGTCDKRSYGLNASDIHWVLTIPAIWGDVAKQFMRECAEQAGIDGSCLSLALEPEAASLFCKHLPLERLTGDSRGQITCFSPGSKYLVLDAGGGTVDITVHEVLHGGNLRELYTANGGPWGGTSVDDAFSALLADIVGPDVMEAFKVQQACDFHDLMCEFEIKKRTIVPQLNSKLTFKIPIALHEVFSGLKQKEIREAVRSRPEYSGKLTFTGDKLRVEPVLVKGLFQQTCDNIVGHLKKVFAEPAVKGATSILMVGGFSDSPMLQEAVKNSFQDKTCIIPNEPGLAVLKGAVVFGHQPKAINARVCRYTYGIKMYRDFVDGQDPDDHRVVKDGKVKCQGSFYKLAEVGQTLSTDDVMPGISLQPADRMHSAITLKVFASPEKNPRFVDDPGTIPLGEVVVDCVDQRNDPTSVHTRLVFGGTELEIRAEATTTGEVTKAKFDFLSLP